MNGAELIAAERKRQVSEEGWDEDHDDDHDFNQLAWAAVCYAAPGLVYRIDGGRAAPHYQDPWPWDEDSDKRPRRNGDLSDAYTTPIDKRVRALVKAGALIAAEIDRLHRVG